MAGASPLFVRNTWFRNLDIWGIVESHYIQCPRRNMNQYGCQNMLRYFMTPAATQILSMASFCLDQ